MVKLVGTLSRLGTSQVLVAGDFLLDTYTIGRVHRISPEAPVAVVKVDCEEHRPGGAGNVVLNLLSLGSRVTALGRVGRDSAGETLTQTLKAEGCEVEALVCQDRLPTPVKNRIMADSQQIVRIDREEAFPLSEHLEQSLILSLPRLLKNVQVLAISDYGKGSLSPRLLKALIYTAQDSGIPIIADPKGIDFAKYRGATVLKHNLSEAIQAAGLGTHASLDDVAGKILEMTDAKVVMITRSQEGISLFYPGKIREDFPVAVREVKDVTGAGDTVLAMLAEGVSM